jgi:hypothetical protein
MNTNLVHIIILAVTGNNYEKEKLTARER